MRNYYSETFKKGKYDDYEAVFKEWLQETIIEVLDSELGNPCHYLPHRGMFKGNSTTKVRPVFDASCRSKNSLSLNDCLETVPNLIENIPPLLMRFRQKEIGVVLDIKKPFLQISVAKEDQDFLRFIWWEDYKERKQKIYRHRRVVFELTSSPFLLAAVLDYHLEQNESHFPETVEKLTNAFYVDNCITSITSQDELKKFIFEAKRILATGCFDLRGWEHSSLTGEE
ncbi:uncharacterized protein LOC118179635 [Stegodyphus dumicola]|uniref:uncharacterized protein LOC118179635 n=1 Tax=Stegodyphus dumicola TaxID=202533 RepID=UPI0015AB419B|nr:uncharacterized protein LOC118179635 [Stegodyphus dumicola]